jgi:hypothetical protein
MPGEKYTIAVLTNYPLDHTSFVVGVESASRGLLKGLAKYWGEGMNNSKG